MKIVGFVPIKLNNQRLPNKNILPLMGKPLCAHIFDTLLQSKMLDEIYVFCSDDSITKYIPKPITFLKRVKELDGDTVKGIEIYKSFTDIVIADIYVLAHATSPFLKSVNIDNAIEKIISDDYDSAVSVKKNQTFGWYKGKPVNFNPDDVPRTQDIEPIYIETSGFYIFTKKIIDSGRRIGYNPWMQMVDDIEALDIDERGDYEFALTISKGLK
jgi:CMP-N-acetylneuraminic acid synthetase